METKEQHIYLVTRGDYSDYTVTAVFTEKKLAKKYINSFKKSDYDEFRIEVYVLNPHEEQLKKDYKPYFVRMAKDGNVKEIDILKYHYNLDNLNIKFDINNNMLLYIFAKDEKHAVKIANEKRGQLIALNRWK